MLDVVVVGAGPIGSRTAYRLASQGHSVMVLEKRAAAGLKICCTGIISQECVSKFDVPLNIVYRQISSARLFSPSDDSIRIVRPQVQAYVVDRSAFDCYLAGLAVGQGVDYRYNSSVESLALQSDRVTLQVSTKGAPSTIEAKAVILACGFNTALVRKAGFGQSRYFTTGVQAEVQAKKLEEVEIYFGRRTAPGFFAWLVPTQDGRALAGLMTRNSAGSHLRNWLSDLLEQGRIEASPKKIYYSGIPMYPLARTYKNRLLVIGDAAGQTKPTTGGGIYFGLLCADVGANTLHNCLLNNNLSSNYLSIYEKTWHRLLRTELKKEYWARRAFQLLNDRQIDALFRDLKEHRTVESLLSAKDISFDKHGNELIKVLRLVLISRLKRLF